MQTSFRSGILRHQTDRNNNPIFLKKVGGNVSIIVSPDPTILTFIDGNKDYIYSESTTVSNAWNTAVDGAYLYWEMSRVTGLVTYKSTMLDPVIQSVAPSNPSTGQLWFDTLNKYWYEFSGGWQRRLVVFATYIDGVALTSMSGQAPIFRGTQVGLNTKQSVGSLVYDLAGSAIQNSLGQFFTTEDDFIAGVPYGSSMRIEALATYAIANNSLAAYSVVRFNDFNNIVQASSGSQLVGTIGIVEEDADVGERIRVIYAGPIINENWDWTSYGIDSPIYVANDGTLSPSPGTGSQLPIARVIDKKTILFEPWLGVTQSSGGGSGVSDHGLLTGLSDNDHPQYLLAASAVTEMTDLSDVDVTNGVGIDNFVLTYDHGTNSWVAEAPVAGVTDHGALTGLNDDDHMIYLLADGTRSLSGALNLAGNNITSVGNITFTGAGTVDGVDVSAHAADATLHFTEASIDHTAILNIGTNTHAQIDTHIADATLHFTEGSIDHTAITNIGTNTHAQIDTHVADGTIHFTKSSINLDDLGDVAVNGSPAIDNFVLTYDNGTGLWGAEASSGGLSNIVEDITPQLGADLDVNGFAIISPSSGEVAESTGNVGIATGDSSYSGGGFSSGAIQLQTGNGTNGNAAGYINLYGGNSDGGGVYAGSIKLYAGSNTGSYGYGGSIDLFAGNGNNTDGYAGNVNITAGSGAGLGGSFNNGNVIISAGGANYAGGGAYAGYAILKGGSGNGNNHGGDIALQAGNANGTGNGGSVVIEVGSVKAGSPVGTTGSVILRQAALGAGVSAAPLLTFNYVTSNVSLRSPETTYTDRVWSLPIDNPATAAGKFLTTDASGQLSFDTPAGGGGGGGSSAYDVVAQSIGVPTDSDILTRMVFTRAVTVGLGSPVTHQGYADIAPVGGAGTITVYKATAPLGGSPFGVSIGTLVFNDGSVNLSSNTIAQTAFAAGDMIYFEMTSGNSMGDLTVTLDASTV